MRSLILIALISCVTLACESEATATESHLPSDVLTDIASLDYSDYIQEWAGDPELQASLGTRQPTGSAETFLATYGVPFDGYGKVERLYLGDLTAKGGFGGCYWALKVMFMGEPAGELGHFDFSGLELVQPIETASGAYSIRTEEGYQEFKKLPVSEQFEIISVALNPLTGKVYETFDSQEWVPGGICIEPVTEAVDRLARGGAVGYYDNVWHVTVYGRAPGSVLVDMDIVGKKLMRCRP